MEQSITIKEKDIKNHKGDIFILLAGAKIFTNIDLEETTAVYIGEDQYQHQSLKKIIVNPQNKDFLT